MSRRLGPGDLVNGYRIDRLLSVGGFAISYKAIAPDGRSVFFKQYKSPSPTKSWYRSYVDYQREIKRRIQASDARRFCYEFIEFFEATAGTRSFFQVFEFVEEGSDLGGIIEKLRGSPGAVSWEQRRIFARVLMAGIRSLHAARVVHCDLKPPNIQLIRDTSVSAGHALKLVDLDFSILADKRAPWHGIEDGGGYVGSPNYLSPEHLKGPYPTPASDVFTCGLILYELMGSGNPYATDGDDQAYARAALAYSAPPPRLAGSLPSDEATLHLVSTLHRCLNPNPKERPTVEEVFEAVCGEPRSSPPPLKPPPAPRKSLSRGSPAPAPPVGPPGPRSDPAHGSLRLVGEGGRQLRFNITTQVGKNLLKTFGDDARYAGAHQFSVERGLDAAWWLVPNTSAGNETLLNGRAVAGKVKLTEGDTVAIGRESKGVAKLPMTVALGAGD